MVQSMSIYRVLDMNIPPKHPIIISSEGHRKRFHQLLAFSEDIANLWSQAMWADARNRSVWQIWSIDESLATGNYHLEILPCMGYMVLGDEIFALGHATYRDQFKKGELDRMGCTLVTEILMYCSGLQGDDKRPVACSCFQLLYAVSASVGLQPRTQTCAKRA